MIHHRHLSNIVNKVNNEKLTTDIRKVFMDELKHIVDFDFAVFDLSKKMKNGGVELYNPVIVSDFSPDFERDFIYEYDMQFKNISYKSWIHSEGKSFVYRDIDVIPNFIDAQSQYYLQYVAKYGFKHVLNCEFAYENKNIGLLTIYRCEGKRDYSNEEIELIKLIIPHVTLSLVNSNDVSFTELAGGVIVLTKRETEIIALVAEGLSNGEIANRLFISASTVKKHLNNIFQKTGSKNRGQLIRFYNSR